MEECSRASRIANWTRSPPFKRMNFKKKITKVRQLVVRLRDDLGLEPNNVATSHSIIGHASLLWEMLTELNGRGLRIRKSSR